MSQFSQLFALAMNAQASVQGDPSATYLPVNSPASATAVSITAIAGPEGDRIRDEETDRVLGKMCQIQVRLDQVTRPAHGDQITLGTGITWSVDVIESMNAGWATLNCVRDVTIEVTGRGYRNRT